jgi:altronate dehydratase small subunit
MSLALVISARDNVATALEPLEAGQTIQAGDTTITLVDAVPRGHKLALRPIAAGDAVVKYGSAIGTASSDIAAGCHVHIHNVASTRGRGDLGGRPRDPRGDAVPGHVDPSAPRIAEPPDSNGAGTGSAERSS